MIDQIIKNESDRIEIDVYYNGALTAPTNIKISTIVDPDGVTRVTDESASPGSSTGRYYYSVAGAITDKLGIYTATWEFTIGGNVYTHIQYFEVVTTIRSGYLTVNRFRDLATYDLVTSDFPSDETIQKHINKASKLIDNYLGGSLDYKTYTETRRCVIDKKTGGLHIQLKKRPIISLTSLTVTTTPSSTLTLDVDNVRINSTAGYIEYFYDYGTSPSALNVCFSGRNRSVVPQATVTYTAGYTSIPEDVEQAATMITEQVLRNTFGEGKEIETVQTFRDTTKYRDSQGVQSAKTLLGLNDVQGALNLLKNYKHTSNIIAGPLG